jgi:hypothetical protein
MARSSAGWLIGAVVIGCAALSHTVRSAAPPPLPQALPRSAPARIEIPRAGVTATIMSVGRLPGGGVAVPPLSRATVAGWYRAGPAPGQAGPAVIVGHIDTYTGPAAFYRLDYVRPGDRVEIQRDDGTTVWFQVDTIRETPKEAFPTRAVFAPSGRPELRVITCGGPFDWAEHSYTDNLIVFAHLVAESRR